MQRGARLFARSMEALLVLGFAALFCVFLLQVTYRYVLGDPLSWTQEIAELLYVWIVCVGSATIVAERDHVTFSLIYAGVKPPIRRILAILGTGFVTAVMIITLYGNFDYIIFTFGQNTPTLRMPMGVVFSAFGVFIILVIATGIARLYRLLRPGWEQEP